MTTDTLVSADDLAAALRDANAVVVAIMTTTGLSNAYVENRRYVDVDEEQERWQSLLDRFDAQIRKEIDQLIRDRDQSMRLARRMNRGDWPSWHVREARAANHRILALRRQLRALGGEG